MRGTTVFVILDWFGGPPMVTWYSSANFPWPMESNTWSHSTWWPIDRRTVEFAARGIAYYWWMGVLAVVLWHRLRRKWKLLLVLVLMPLVTTASCRIGYHAEQFSENAAKSLW